MILLNPGPVVLSAGVRAAMGGPDICHREPELAALQSEIRRRLLAVYDADPMRHAAVLVAGSGTAAVESMLVSLVPRGARLLVVENGAYGERMAHIARAAGIDVVSVVAAWGEPAPLDALRTQLRADPRARCVAVVHHETTTGRLDDLGAIARACVEHSATVLVDAVSSFGAEAIPLGAPGIVAVASTAGKCLHGVPGVSFVVAARDALLRDGPGRGYYLDLRRHHAAQEAESTAFTPPVPAYRALLAALVELEAAGGWAARNARYASLAAQVERGLVPLGFRPLLAAHESSVALRSYRLPPGRSYQEIHDGLRSRGFVIYAGQSRPHRESCEAGDVMRISTMGEIGADDIRALVAATGELLACAPPRETDRRDIGRGPSSPAARRGAPEIEDLTRDHPRAVTELSRRLP